jgi:hypothetical protein
LYDVKPHRMALVLFVTLIALGACVSSNAVGAGPLMSVGRNLVATVAVLEEGAEFEFPGGDTATGLTLEVREIHWIGDPQPWTKDTPDVAVGDVLMALRLPKSDYRVGETYVASLSFIDEATYGDFGWWLSTGIDAHGDVITNKGDANDFRETLDIADGVDGDTDDPGVLMADYAAEIEAVLNARDSGVGEDDLPLGPMLTAIYEETGWVP